MLGPNLNLAIQYEIEYQYEYLHESGTNVNNFKS